MLPIVVGDLTIHYDLRRVEVCGVTIQLRPREWNILESLGLCAGSMVTREMLLAVCHPRAHRRPRDRSVDLAVSRARGKLARASGGRNYIVAVDGGYVLRPPDPLPAEI